MDLSSVAAEDVAGLGWAAGLLLLLLGEVVDVQGHSLVFVGGWRGRRLHLTATRIREQIGATMARVASRPPPADGQPDWGRISRQHVRCHNIGMRCQPAQRPDTLVRRPASMSGRLTLETRHCPA